MKRLNWLVAFIVALVLFSIWVVMPDNPGIHLSFGPFKLDRNIKVHQGLDLVGGMQVTLEADVPPGTRVEGGTMQAAQAIIENRVNGLGVSEPLIQLQQESNRILVELPGIANPDEAIASFKGTGLLEFVDTGLHSLPPGMTITTSLGGPASTAVGSTPTAVATPAAGATAPADPTVYNTILTGRDLQSADVGFDNYGRPMIQFSLTSEGGKKFAEHTKANIEKYLTITMDKQVLSSPVIRSAITDGSGVIEGQFSLEEAQAIVLQLKYGALPVPLKVVENRTVGPTLGEDSVHKSLIAGTIGLGIVAFFMVAYYGFPGVIAVFALALYTLFVFALYKLIPVVLTLTGIAGFILSIGMAVDANVLIFERTKEELRSGKTIAAAIEAGFSRAWSSIFDSNVSTLITCAILFWFGMNFGASIIRGFALTLGIGVIVSMFTAITVTRTVLRLLFRYFSQTPERVALWHRLWDA